MKITKHILGISQLLIFLTFVAIGGLQGILQSEKNNLPDHTHISVQHKPSACIEQGVYEIDVEKESESGKFIKHTSGLGYAQTFSDPAGIQAGLAVKHLPKTHLHSRPIFLEVRTFRI